MSKNTVRFPMLEVDLYDLTGSPIVCDNEIMRPYITALNSAIKAGLVTEPGKYRIYLEMDDDTHIFHVHPVD